LLNGLSELSLTDNQIRDQGLAALVAPCKGGRALGALSVLDLGTNLIGSAGLASLSAALAESAFPNLTELFLYENKIDSLAALLGAVRRSGCESLGAEFTDTLREGAFASLRTFRVGYNETTETCKQALKKACEARSIRLEGVTPHSHSFESAMISSFGA
jgi:Ran GTPase-activating protein (RanGAP) involved in mRNA processing and transport